MRCFFLDAETDGLYGIFLSVAALVTDEYGKELDRFYCALEPEKANIRSQWVKENVLPHLSEADQLFESETELLEAFWVFWLKYREGVICVSDVSYPVEARLFSTCVMRDLHTREFQGPYPLFDLSTLLLARGIDPDAARPQLARMNIEAHNAMNDVTILSSIWREYINDSKS